MKSSARFAISRIFAKFSFSFGMTKPPQLPPPPVDPKPHIPRTVAMENMKSFMESAQGIFTKEKEKP